MSNKQIQSQQCVPASGVRIVRGVIYTNPKMPVN